MLKVSQLENNGSTMSNPVRTAQLLSAILPQPADTMGFSYQESSLNAGMAAC